MDGFKQPRERRRTMIHGGIIGPGFGIWDLGFGEASRLSLRLPDVELQNLRPRCCKAAQILRFLESLQQKSPMIPSGTPPATGGDMAGTITSYRDLVVWQRGMDLAELVFRMTARFPDTERFGLSTQMRKAAASIPSNIAEGHRHRRASYVHHVVIALGSHAELETQVLLAQRLGFAKADDIEKFGRLSAQVGELAHGLLRSLETRS